VQTTVVRDRDIAKASSLCHTPFRPGRRICPLESRHCQWTATFPASRISRSVLRPIFMVCTVAPGLSPATHSVHRRMMLIHSAVPLCPPVWRVDGISRPIAAFLGIRMTCMSLRAIQTMVGRVLLFLSTREISYSSLCQSQPK
jgi:hypothetical protein